MHQPYQEILGHPPDFGVLYYFYPIEEGGRYVMPVQGYKSNFRYAERWPDNNGTFMIWPEFEDEQGNVILEKDQLYVAPIGTARMWIFNAEMRKIHQQRLKVGTKGYFVEGSKKVAECEVIELSGLMSNPIEPGTR